MNILGICNANNSGAALIVDGKVIAAVNEERFIRVKQTRDFPENAINYVLKVGHLTLDEVDYIGCGAWAGIDSEETLPSLMHEFSTKVKQGDWVADIAFDRLNASIKSDGEAKTKLIRDAEKFGISRTRIHFCDHHRSHALTAFYPSEFEEAIVLVADGRGDFRAVSIWEASRTNGMKCLHTVSEMNSLGAMYGYITKLLGFIPDRHEGKVTGLSARGEPSEVFEMLSNAIRFNTENGGIEAMYGDIYLPFMDASLSYLEDLAKAIPKENLAYAAQAVLEKTLSEYLSFYLEKFYKGKKVNLCLSGGCAANVKLNFELSKLSQVKSLYVSPEMGDGGNALGGAINCLVNFTSLQWVEMQTVYLGPEYSNDHIADTLAKEGVLSKKLVGKSKLNFVADELENGKIIGWFQGRMEYGPRALGARSILASPSDSTINDALNQRLNRTEFMPFAPVTTDELASKLFVSWDKKDQASRFMTICYECTDLFRNKCPATVHVDNTARPQVISEVHNPEYFNLIELFYQKTGIPSLINTSFNHHEEPIVCSPEDAIRSFLKGNVDILVIGDFVVTSSKQNNF